MRDDLLSIKDESGVALVTGLVMLVLLTAIGTYAINMTQIDEALSANLRASKQAFYLADAGIEWGRQQVVSSMALPPQPVNATQTLNGGSYSVTYPSVFPAGPAMQYTVTVRSVGTLGTASKTLEAVVTKTFSLSDAAIAMRGNEAHSEFTGNSFLVDGRDYDHVTGALTGAAAELGISVPSPSLESVVEGELSSQTRGNVKGLGGTTTIPSVGVSSSLPSSAVTAIANTLCSSADTYIPINGEYSDSNSKTFGTVASPKITCFDGKGTPGSMGVEFKGKVEGAGILIVKHADLVTKGAFSYDGLIIVTGNKVGFGMMGGGKQDVYGSLLINETSTDGSSYKELILTGNAAVMRSQSALALARQLINPAALSGVIPSLPALTRRVSWVEVNN
jgi:Tfp pilus assembly protein PilX